MKDSKGLDELEKQIRAAIEEVPEEASRLIENGLRLKDSAATSVSPLLQKLFSFLNSDFYVGQSMYSIFEHVYPDEFFNLESSPEKIRQIVFRLRDQLGAAGVGLDVFHEDGRYSLASQSGLTAVVCAGKEDAGEPIMLKEIRSHFAGEEFRLEDLAKKLNISNRSVSTRVKEAVQAGYLEKIGAGPKTRYRVLK